MATSGGLLGSGELAATTYTTGYKPASGVLATVRATLCNRSASTRTVRVAVVSNASSNPTPGDGGFLIYDTVLQGAGDQSDRDKLALNGIVLNGSGDDQVVFYASGVDVDYQVQGVTETA